MESSFGFDDATTRRKETDAIVVVMLLYITSPYHLDHWSPIYLVD